MKRILALILSSLMLLTFVSCDKDDVVAEGNDNTPVKGAEVVEEQKEEEPKEEKKNYPDNILMENFDSTLHDHDVMDEWVKTVTFLDTLEGMPEDAWDISKAQDKSVMAWATNGGDDLYIAGEGGVTASSCDGLFMNFRSAVSINFNGCFYTDLVDRISEMFMYCESLETLDLSGWNTSGMRYMDAAFRDCKNLKSVNLTGWDTSNVEYLGMMFERCMSLENVDLSHFDTSKIANFSEMFSYCKKLTSVDLSTWDTSAAKSMESMFEGCQSLKTVDGLKIPEGCITDNMYNGTPLA